MKKAFVYLLCLSVLLGVNSSIAFAQNNNNIISENSEIEQDDYNEQSDDKTTSDEQDLAECLSDKQAIELCELACENDNLALYLDEENDRIALYDKQADKYWWNSPVNAYADIAVVDKVQGKTMKKVQRKQLASSLVITYADLRQEKRQELDLYSYECSKISYKTSQNEIVVKYKYRMGGFEIPVHYQLNKDCLKVYVQTKDIKESNIKSENGKEITKIAIAPQFGAADSQQDGYMIVPDGSGAVINYNNNKGNYPVYSQKIYGRDYTAVPLKAPAVTEQAYLPVVATVGKNAGLVEIASSGDGNCFAKANVCGQNNQTYNTCYFQFELRSSDGYYMGGDNTDQITVFEKGKIKTDKIEVCYYPVQDKQKDLNPADIARVYRNYLVNQGFSKKENINCSSFYVDFYGGVLKKKSVLGVPINQKTKTTGFEQAGKIIDALKENGIGDYAINYNDWTNDSIKNKISDGASASSKLGGKSALDKLIKKVEKDNADIYLSQDNTIMEKGSFDYPVLGSTAIRISNAYSRQSEYSVAFGVPLTSVSPALLSPSKYSEVMDGLVSSFKNKGYKGICFGDYNSMLVSDHSKKKNFSREKTMQTVEKKLEKASKDLKVLGQNPNAYVIPYANALTDLPIYSSGFNIEDYEIPFYQMAVHGYIEHAVTAINKSSDPTETFLRAIVSGSNLHYDFFYSEASEVVDTDYDTLFYANYSGWLGDIKAQNEIVLQTMQYISNLEFTSYTVSGDNNNILTAVFGEGADKIVLQVDTDQNTIKFNGQNIDTSKLKEGENIEK